MTAAEDPTDALSILSDETRIAILRTLAEADGPLAFSRLRDRAGVADSGRFSYHLRRLCEYFVRETDDGYELGHAGTRLVDAAGVGSGGADGPVRRDGGENSSLDRESPAEFDPEVCPVCGEADCEKFFGVHLSPPWA